MIETPVVDALLAMCPMCLDVKKITKNEFILDKETLWTNNGR